MSYSPSDSPFAPEVWSLDTPQRYERFTPARLGDYLKDTYSPTATFIDVSYTNDDGDDVTILTGEQAHQIMRSRYADRILDIPLEYDSDSSAWVIETRKFVYDGTQYESLATVNGYLWYLWHVYWNTNTERFSRIYEVMTESYDPLWNTDKTETVTTSYGHSIETALTHGEKVVTTDAGTRSTDVNVYGLNSSSGGADSEDSTLTIATTNTGTHSGTDTTETAHDGEDIVSTRAYGNIGVTTSAELATGEIELRQYQLAESMVKAFISTYTHY